MAETARAALAAVIYGEGRYPDQIFSRTVRDLQTQGLRLAGIIQHDVARSDRIRCDMILEELSTGALIGLSEDRGKESRGCRIDQNGLMRAASLILQTLTQDPPDLLIINKFGKVEAEGGGLREVIGEALALDIPVLIGVSLRNIEAWRAFAGSFACELGTGYGEVEGWINATIAPASAPERMMGMTSGDLARETM